MTSVDTAPRMTTTADQLNAALQLMAEPFPAVHPQMVIALGRSMTAGGVMEFTLSELAKTSGVRLSVVKDYVRTAREHKVLELLGRRTDNGRIRYCAYQRADTSTDEKP